jgi:hypothetical protein
MCQLEPHIKRILFLAAKLPDAVYLPLNRLRQYKSWIL